MSEPNLVSFSHRNHAPQQQPSPRSQNQSYQQEKIKTKTKLGSFSCSTVSQLRSSARSKTTKISTKKSRRSAGDTTLDMVDTRKYRTTVYYGEIR